SLRSPSNNLKPRNFECSFSTFTNPNIYSLAPFSDLRGLTVLKYKKLKMEKHTRIKTLCSSVFKSMGGCFYASDKGENVKASESEVPKYSPEAAMVAAAKHFSGKVRLC
ncbi:hypothetical protein Pfo_009604, partial [Paulownia fortunei]